ncbi:MAG: hypothetical protein AB8B74_10615 [Crocinitomicaceae bacterium]
MKPFKIYFLFTLVFIQLNTISFAQSINAFEVVVNKLVFFNASRFSLIEQQVIEDLNVGLDYVTYRDARGDYQVYYNGSKKMLTRGRTKVSMTNNFFAYQIASVLRVFDKGESTILTSYAGSYGVGDSLIVFQDRIGGNLKYFYKNEIVEFSQVLGDYMFSENMVGENTFVFNEVGGNYKAFYQGHFTLLISTNQPVNFSAGMNIIAFNDPENYTFSIFEKGEIIDVETQFVETYQTGYDFVFYRDNNGVNKVYYHGEIKDLGYDLQEVQISDSIIFFKEADYAHIWYDGEVYSIYNDQVKDFQVSGGSIAYINSSGGVSALIRGKSVEISRQKVQKYNLVGNTIALQYTPSSFSVWWNGKMFDY